MYSQKFIAVVKVGQVCQKELANGTVILPFSSEYSLFLKNRNNVRAVAVILIDGENVSGNGFVVPANGSIEIERPLNSTNKFKFVSLDSVEAQMEGKSGPNPDKLKGLIEVRFFLEKVPLKIVEVYTPYERPRTYIPRPRRPVDPYYPWWTWDAATYTSTAGKSSLSSTISSRSSKVVPTYSLSDSKALDDGCTVEGSYSNQNFGTSYVEVEDTYVSVKLFLQGYEVPKYPLYAGPGETSKEDTTLTDLVRSNEDLERYAKELERQEALRKKIQAILDKR